MLTSKALISSRFIRFDIIVKEVNDLVENVFLSLRQINKNQGFPVFVGNI